MWNRLRFSFSSVFRRFQLLLGSLAVILLAVFLPLSASADTISINSGFGNVSSSALITRYSDGLPVNRVEQQYFYGGAYNPLIIADSQQAGYTWTEFDVSAYVTFNRSIPAGTTLTISCGGWYNKAYDFGSSTPVMIVSPWNIADISNYTNYLGDRAFFNPVSSGGYVQTPNGNYRGILYTCTYTTTVDLSGIYLCFSGFISTGRTGSAYFGISCSDISYQGTPVSPAESDIYGTPESGALDDTSTAIDNVESAESALISGGESAISGAFDSLTSSVNSLNAFVSGFVFVQRLFSSLVTSLPFLNVLIPISVGLGLFAMLVGVIGSVVSRSKGGGKDDSSG